MTRRPSQDQGGDLPCIEVVELLTDYLEGALPAAVASRLERHLRTCPGCSEYLAQMRTLAGSLRDLAGESVSAEMRDRIVRSFGS
ncbi:MAG TPA: zf-HC2 domain-containing protein [Thermoleophilaceae bacterium]|nr:zf-HC2 domain-containing protein [Thermoleophilaceae bacterium]